MRRLHLLVAIALALFAFGPTTALAAHNGNNKAEITGTGDPDAAGQAVVNYSEGTGLFNGRITVRNLEPGETYRFFVRGAGGERLVCEGEANRQGVFTCNAQQIALPGFTQAVVRDSAGTEVASGVFARRGNCRDPEQAGSLCKAPGQNK
ncbi:MAG: hypothetical protein M3356_04670 [Actinomycetota bacterium]|nr:hypothetical protein [Actinomycetota bacterium]